MTRDHLDGLRRAGSCLMLVCVLGALLVFVALRTGVVPPHRPAHARAAPALSYCVEPGAATFAPCRTVIADSVWPL